MDSVPLEFIDRTINLVAPPGGVRPSPFATLQGSWGQYAEYLDDGAECVHVCMDPRYLPDLCCFFYHRETRLSAEDVLKMKQVNVASVSLSFVTDTHRKMDDQEREMLQRLLERNTGLTTLTLDWWPNEIPVLAAILGSIPRISAMSITCSAYVDDRKAVLALVEKHAKRSLRALHFKEGISFRNLMFPAIPAFLMEPGISFFHGEFFRYVMAEQMIKHIAENLKTRIHRPVKATLMEETKKYIAEVTREWVDEAEEIPNCMTSPARFKTVLKVKHIKKHTYTLSVATVHANPPLMDLLKAKMGDLKGQWPERPFHVYTPSNFLLVYCSEVEKSLRLTKEGTRHP